MSAVNQAEKEFKCCCSGMRNVDSKNLDEVEKKSVRAVKRRRLKVEEQIENAKKTRFFTCNKRKREGFICRGVFLGSCLEF